MTNILKVNGKFDLKKLIISILISEGLGALSAFLSGGGMKAYATLQQPSFAPPAWLFGVVWPILFLLMAIASYRIWMLGKDNAEVKDALFYYLVQLGFNFLWSILFFRFELRGLALVDLLILLVFIIITTVKFFRLDKAAGYLMLPYLIWVAFAGFLNFSVWQLNK